MSRGPKKPPVLNDIDALRTHLKHELWKRQRYDVGRNTHRRIENAETMLKKLESVEQFVREHMPEEQWKGFIG